MFVHALVYEEGIDESAFYDFSTDGLNRKECAEELVDTVQHELEASCYPSRSALAETQKSYVVLIELLSPEAANRIEAALDVTLAVKHSHRKSKQELGRLEDHHADLTAFCQLQFLVVSCSHLSRPVKYVKFIRYTLGVCMKSFRQAMHTEIWPPWVSGCVDVSRMPTIMSSAAH